MLQHILICDDHPLVAQALAAIIRTRWPSARTTLVGDYPAAIAQMPGVDLAMVDLDMPGATPRAGIAALRAAAPLIPLIIITGSADDQLLLELLAAGTSGFIPKTATPAVIAAAIDLVLAGGRYLPPRLIELASEPQPSSAPATAGSPPLTAQPLTAQPLTASPLTARQTEVAALLVRGFSNKDMARELNVAPATIKSHLAQVMAMLGAENRTDAAIRARMLGIV